MTDPESSYRPRSPDFSSLQSFPNTFNNTYQPQPPFPASPLDQRASYDASPFFAGGYQPPVVNNQIPQPHFQQPFHYNPAFDDMSRRSARISAQSNAQSPPLTHLSEHNFIFDEHVPAVAPKALNVDEPQPKPWDGVDVRTKFPVARIKRIMQADEEVGKVAQVTPIAVSKALELFMISLVTKAAQEARDRNSKRVTAAHLKQAVSKDEVLDFLADICSKVPDHHSKKTEEDGSDHNEGKRKSGGGRRRKDVDSDDF